MWQPCLSIILAVILVSTAFSAEPTSQPATQPAVTFDSPEALTTQLAVAIEARDRKAVCDAFRVDLAKEQLNSNGLWVEYILANLRLRDAMVSRFGADTTLAAIKDIRWLAVPDTQRLRATKWTVDGNSANVRHERNEDDFFRIAGVIMFVTKKGESWNVDVSEPASGATELRQNRELHGFITQADELTKAVQEGKYKTVEEVAEVAKQGDKASQ